MTTLANTERPAISERSSLCSLLNPWGALAGAGSTNDPLSLYAQPIVDLGSGQTTQYELLLRVHDEEGRACGPSEFLAAVEGTELARALDRWVVRQAIDLLGRVPAGSASLQVNLPAQAFCDRRLPKYVQRELHRQGADPGRLVFEVTETSGVVDMEQARRFLRQLKGLGCRFALDDFGTGFSSLYRLKCLEVDYLKIDRCFIHNLARDGRDQALVRSVVATARGLGIGTIAEGVEDEATARMVRELGVDYAQGFHLGRPASTDRWPIVTECLDQIA